MNVNKKMAGIGFELRKLARQDDLSGLVKAYGHSAFAATGPWLFTLIALGVIMIIGNHYITPTELLDFRTIIIYNFSFSLVMSGPIFMIATRYLADCIHSKDVSTVPGMLFGCLTLAYITQIPVTVAFYTMVASFPPDVVMAAVINTLLISTIWIASIFITTLKDYHSVSRAFLIGMAVAIIAAGLLSQLYGVSGMLNGFSIGIVILLSLLFAQIFTAYPYEIKQPFAFLSYFVKYWEIALGGLIYNAAIWVDKWVMWFAPESTYIENGLRLYPNYDSAMFFAYLTIIPSMALFIFNIETGFHEKYVRFYRDIDAKATFRKILKNHHEIVQNIFGSARNFIFLQGGICIMVLMIAPMLFDMFGINYLQIGIFRNGVLGALFHVLTMLLMILLSYFDNRKGVLMIQILFLVCNALFTFITIHLGFEYYGYGYFLTSMITFAFAAIITSHYVTKLPYHTFITTNSSV